MLDRFKFQIKGRPDGLGNRFEEIVFLEAYCEAYNYDCIYLWNNFEENRTYDIKINTNRVKVQNGRVDVKLPFKSIHTLKDEFSQEQMLAAGKQIKPNFDIGFSNDIKPIGIHIRSTDRIGKKHPLFMKDETELKRYLSAAVGQINNIYPEFIFICSESKRVKNIFIKYLNPSIQLVEPVCPDTSVSDEYIDFFALTLCKEVWMVSKFSSFSILAARIGNIPLICFNSSDMISHRHKVKLNYKPIGSSVVITERVLEPKLIIIINKVLKLIRYPKLFIRNLNQPK